MSQTHIDLTYISNRFYNFFLRRSTVTGARMSDSYSLFIGLSEHALVVTLLTFCNNNYV